MTQLTAEVLQFYADNGYFPLEEITKSKPAFTPPKGRLLAQPSPSGIQQRYGVDIQNVMSRVFIPYDSDERINPDAQYLTLTDEESDSLLTQWRNLPEHAKQNPNPVNRLVALYDAWKENSAPREKTQRLEWIVRNAFGADLPIRASTDPQDGIQKVWSEPPERSEEGALLDFHTISMGFLNEWWISPSTSFDENPRITLYRAARGVVAGKLFADALNNPDREGYRIDTKSVIWGHSTNPVIEMYYSDGIVLEHEVPVSEIIGTVDHLLPKEEVSEAEIHILGGGYEFSPEQVRIGKPDLAVDKPLRELIIDMETPTMMNENEILITYKLLKCCARDDCPGSITTDEGKETLRRWVNTEKVKRRLQGGYPEAKECVSMVISE